MKFSAYVFKINGSIIDIECVKDRLSDDDEGFLSLIKNGSVELENLSYDCEEWGSLFRTRKEHIYPNDVITVEEIEVY
jgi:hypothetical protein